MNCQICPRKCKVDRTNKKGFCGQSEDVCIAKADLFCWEEPVVSGKNGSGAIFFSGCNLKCCFCQNYQLSHDNFGKKISIKRLSEIFKELEDKGACNINLISPTHFAMQIMQALDIYKPAIPIIYNCNGYESVETIDLLAKYVDVFLVDLKFCDTNLSQKYCKAKDYFDVATKAIREMIKVQPKVVLENGLIKKGVIIRHLVMPNCIEDSKKILQWIDQNAKGKCLISLMCQYTPCFDACKFEEINRTITPLEYKVVLNFATKLGLTDGFAQDMDSAEKKYIPVWDFKGI